MNPKLNVLLVVTDEQRISEVGAYGKTPCMTPNLDRLANSSRVYENTYTSCPLCSPARGSVLTGQYPHSHGVTANTTDIGCSVSELNDTPRLLPRLLSKAGYSCGFNGKWHLGTPNGGHFGSTRQAALPSHFGFEGMDFPGHGGIGIDYPQYKEYLKANNLTAEIEVHNDMYPLPYGTWQEGPEAGVPHFITSYTISLMEEFRKRAKPFFMHHNFWGPHQPYFVPDEYLRLYDNIDIPEWESFNQDASDCGRHTIIRRLPGENRRNWKAWERMIKHKYAFATYIDHQVGRMLDYLEESGLADSTIVIFTADHGDNLGAHGGLLDKGFVHFEEVHRIPLLVKIPGEGPKRYENLSSLLDVYPTILDTAGIDIPEDTHGRSLINESLPPRKYVVSEFHGLNDVTLSMRTVRSGNMKYGWTCCSEELYDLDSDPHELHNLADDPDKQEVLNIVRHQLLEWTKESNDPLFRQYERTLRNLD